ncbi:MAG: hypothetical protein KDB86_00230 [Actinobacteria bacterium]|nr:hypothetical protein [Actinomycetota bacterium]MCB9388382.1 hypothetical protein [Acidimicrobiia bacterium]
MQNAVYVYSGYALTFGVLGAYGAWVTARARSLEVDLRQAKHDIAIEQERRTLSAEDVDGSIRAAVDLDGDGSEPGVHGDGTSAGQVAP